MKILQNKAVKTHIISGFLGAGKTTVLQHLLKQKPEHEKWAILMNEFGQIGIDQQLLPQNSGFEIKELLGGCLCCSSQLPMQIALSRLLNETKPDRLFIEPTGLGHPAELIEQLTEPHWQQSIDMRALVIVVDGSRLHDEAWRTQNLYQDQLKAAEIVVISHTDVMNSEDQHALQQLKIDYQAYVKSCILAEHGQVELAQIDLDHVAIQRKIQPLLKVQKTILSQAESTEMPVVKQLPYHYVESANGYTVAGWKFPKRWQFDFYPLLDVLCDLQDWLRIKAIFSTDQGWKSFNFNPEQFNYKSAEENIDNRIEIITQNPLDWEKLEALLLECQLNLQ